ncbi:zinc-ribbon domain-containing protein [Haloplanus sp. GCM10025708]|uniref:zinc-ribbon domain-containing protein n=1 Tax=Haloferacaceae TaxID=1644056 RepID=UPI00360B44C8
MSEETELTLDDVDQRKASELKEYHLEKIRKEAESTNDPGPLYLRGNPRIRGGAVVGLLVFGTAFGALIMPTSPEAAAMFGVMVSGVGLFTITQWGVATRRALRDAETGNQQQQQGKPSSKSKQICSNCGWKNPKANNYCHDCGAELDSE